MSAVLPPEKNRMQPDHLPTPFSAGEIRAACGPGRVNVFRIEARGEPTTVLRWEFTGGDAERGDSVRRVEGLDGSVFQDSESSSGSWVDFQRHASYPAAGTTVAESDVVTPAGSFTGWVYTTRDDDGVVRRSWFARELPGPPVRFETEVDGIVTSRSVLIDFVDVR